MVQVRLEDDWRVIQVRGLRPPYDRIISTRAA
jgi:hypothetical protein